MGLTSHSLCHTLVEPSPKQSVHVASGGPKPILKRSDEVRLARSDASEILLV